MCLSSTGALAPLTSNASRYYVCYNVVFLPHLQINRLVTHYCIYIQCILHTPGGTIPDHTSRLRERTQPTRRFNVTNIFVFGSNRQGRHGKGAALTARLHHGAIYGQAHGLQGNSYAIVSKELRTGYPSVTFSELTRNIIEFREFAASHPTLHFNITRVGCGLAGFNWEEVGPLFLPLHDNCSFI